MDDLLTDEQRRELIRVAETMEHGDHVHAPAWVAAMSTRMLSLPPSDPLWQYMILRHAPDAVAAGMDLVFVEYPGQAHTRRIALAELMKIDVTG